MSEVPLQALGVAPLPSKKEHLEGLLPESQGQNLALTVFYVPCLLACGAGGSGPARVFRLERG